MNVKSNMKLWARWSSPKIFARSELGRPAMFVLFYNLILPPAANKHELCSD